MDEAILNILTTYGVETVVIALIINVLTHFLKLPIKAYSRKSGRNANRYICLIPVALGFAGAFGYKAWTVGIPNIVIDDLAALAVSSASLSLAMFAIIEKFLPKKKDMAVGVETAPAETDALQSMREALEVVKRLVGVKEAAGILVPESAPAATSAPETPIADTTLQSEALPQNEQTAVVPQGVGQALARGGKIVLGRKKDANGN